MREEKMRPYREAVSQLDTGTMGRILELEEAEPLREGMLRLHRAAQEKRVVWPIPTTRPASEATVTLTSRTRLKRGELRMWCGRHVRTCGELTAHVPVRTARCR